MKNLFYLFLVSLLFLNSCSWLGYSELGNSRKDKYVDEILQEIRKNKQTPDWVYNFESNIGFANFGKIYFNKKTDNLKEKITKAENQAKIKIIEKINFELLEIITQLFNEYAIENRQSIGVPTDVVNKIMRHIPLKDIYRQAIYLNNKNKNIYVYMILEYKNIVHNIDEINLVVQNELIKYKFSPELIEYTIELIKKLFNVFDEERI